MKKYRNHIFMILLFLILVTSRILGVQAPGMKIAPMNPAFVNFQQQQQSRTRNVRNFNEETHELGLIPDPIIPEIHQPDPNEIVPAVSRFDLRDTNNDLNTNDNLMTPVRDQLACGACWSFASYGVLEHLLKKQYHLSNDINDFSESHLIFHHGFDIKPCAGGNLKMSAAYLFRKSGPVKEFQAPYGSSSEETCQECVPDLYIDSIVFMPVRSDTNDIGYIKNELYNHGALYSSLYFNENNYDTDLHTYYYDDPDDSFNDSNHAIVIVGWDDNHYISGAPEVGAFIVRNSFGSDWGESGYFYVSYFDESIAFTKLGYFDDTPDESFQFEHIFQHDILGWTGSMGTGDGSDWAANSFTTDEAIFITGVGFYTTGANTTCSIDIYQEMKAENGYAKLTESLLIKPIVRSYVYSGYYIVLLNTPLLVSSGETFVVVLHYWGENNSYGIPIETPINGYASTADSKEGQSYVSDDGLSFIDINYILPHTNNCIKAYAISYKNTPPSGIPQEIYIKEDHPVTIKLSGNDPNHQSLGFFLLTYPQYGQLSGQIPSITYTPDLNFNGTDLFHFVANNGTQRSENTSITINVIPVNDPPTPSFTSIRINEDESFSLSNIGTDPDGDVVYCYISKPPGHGIISDSIIQRSYTPAVNYNGQDQFVFYLNDRHSSTEDLTMNITIEPVNDPPVVSDCFYTISEDTQKIIVLNASDVDNEYLTYSIENYPAHGRITGIPPNLIYIPEPDYTGTDEFTFKANDGLIDSQSARCQIQILSMNDNPSANDMTLTITENQALTFTLTANDNENDPLTYMIISSPQNGYLSGTLPGCEYTPNYGYSGTDTFTFKVFDGMLYSEPATVNINVIANNTQPSASNQTIILFENDSVAITLAGDDPDKDALHFSIVNPPMHGNIKGELPLITYTPVSDYNGFDSLTYLAHDAFSQSEIGKIFIIIKKLNAPPIANSARIITNKNVSKRFYLSANDPDNDQLFYYIVSEPSHGTIIGEYPLITYIPNDNFTGFDSLSFRVNDGKVNSTSATINIIVTEFNAVTDRPDLDQSGITIFTEDFESDTSEWTFGTGGQTNKWFLGTATSFDGVKSAYISQDGGVSATYDENTSSDSWLSRAVDLSGIVDATLSFYWKGVGEETFFVWFDYGEFYINNGSDVLISEAKEFVDNNSWTQKTFDLSSYAGDTIDLKFKWKNDGSSKDGDPAFCVDNIQISGAQIKPGSGNALDLDGSNDYVALSNGSVAKESVNMPPTISVEAWVKVRSFTDYSGIIGFVRDTLGSEGGWILGVMSGNRFYFAVTTEFLTVDEIYYLNTGSNYSTDTWYHVAGTYDGTTMKIYVNGLEAASLEPGFDGDIYYRNTYYTIGAYKDDNETHYFDGQIDEVRVWNGLRTPDQIRANMCKKLNPDIEPTLLDYYHMDHDNSIFVDDYKGGNNNGTLMNMDNNSDWVNSGAAIGDMTIYDYVGISATDFCVSLAHADGDQFTACGQSGDYSGLHLYLINEFPSNTTPPGAWNHLHTHHYWGIFSVGHNMIHNISYNYNGVPGIHPDWDINMAVRHNATESWSEPSGVTVNTESKTIRVNESSSITHREYILGISNQAPEINLGDTVSVVMDKNNWPRTWIAPSIIASDADNDPLTWTVSIGPVNGIVSISTNGISPAINYTPNEDYIGLDSCVIKVDDGHNGVDTITINISIKPGANQHNLPNISPDEGANETLEDDKGLILYHLGPGRMVVPRMKIQ